MNPPPKRAGRPSGFSFSAPTAPRVDDPAPPPPPPVPAAPEAKTPRRQDAKTSPEAKRPESIAYTWRITPDLADTLDDLVRHVRKQLGLRKLDRPPVLDGLVAIATASDEVRAALIRHLKQKRHDA